MFPLTTGVRYTVALWVHLAIHDSLHTLLAEGFLTGSLYPQAEMPAHGTSLRVGTRRKQRQAEPDGSVQVETAEDRWQVGAEEIAGLGEVVADGVGEGHIGVVDQTFSGADVWKFDGFARHS